jgi:hypothetical protein
MIVFDLCCSNGHVFEAWFKDSKAYDSQRRRKKVECPACGDVKIDKALMAPNIATSEKRANADEQAIALRTQAMRALSEARKYVEENCEYVGNEFAEEARKIHFGETEKRDIYGEASKDEADSLREDGVEFAEIPWVPRADN